ncbi:hypothetical protein CGMCC3_g1850 [Colletotrichum fructicola]|uniref:Uncharacterized protein n=1 Tax=Colletotrichum chrysophilum TaxID=1836956 RepID=A0AAD9B2D7_9PEZI|nr:uncharacterized protein CGMCC3_g1850 [Colletotrichum fructicola]KAE9582522.1 hypothetical protein CGMCC3_g1850 [Colletotrichum fructicola]KAK1857095.1 hypothetical protein CCHR01_00169 [Colletotrichum chrysophilum]
MQKQEARYTENTSRARTSYLDDTHATTSRAFQQLPLHTTTEIAVVWSGLAWLPLSVCCAAVSALKLEACWVEHRGCLAVVQSVGLSTAISETRS